MRNVSLIGLIALLAVTGFADVPQLISYQGRLTDDITGDPIADGTYNVTFRLFDVIAGGTAIWTENYPTLSVANGLYFARLGTTTPFTADMTFDEPYWLEVQVGATILSPRYQLCSSPYTLGITDTLRKSSNQVIFSSEYSGVEAVILEVYSSGYDNSNAVVAINNGGGEPGAATNYSFGRLAGYDDTPVDYSRDFGVWGHAYDDGVTAIGVIGSYGADPLHPDNWAYLSSPYFAGYFDGPVKFMGEIEDNDGDFGTAGQVLTSTGSGVDWTTLGGGSDNDWAYSSGSGLTGDVYHTGNVGIGHSDAPSAMLHIYHSTMADIDLENSSGTWRITNPGSNNLFFHRISDVSDVLVLENGTGYVGVGHAYPNARLHIQENDGTDIFMADSATTNKVIVKANGDVGIGTSAPLQKLSVLFAENNDGISMMADPSYTSYLRFWKTPGTLTGYMSMSNASNYLRIHANSPGVVAIGAGSSEHMRVTGDGYVGIGTTTPDNFLHVEGDESRGLDSLGVVNVFNTHDGTSHSPAIYCDSRTSDGFGIGGVFTGGYMAIEALCSADGTHSGYYYSGIEGTVSGGDSYRKYGVYGAAYGGTVGTNYGIYGTASGGTTAYAGYFAGNVHVTGSLSKGSGSFLIDHPLDPENKTLRHNFVESPENLCLYRGKVALDSDGRATVEMPNYFAALTKEDEATIQLTPIGARFIAAYEWNNDFTAFTILGDAGQSVSYTVYADRDDPVMHQLYRPVEEEKGKGNFEKGLLIYPEAYGYPPEKGFDNQRGENEPENK